MEGEALPFQQINQLITKFINAITDIQKSHHITPSTNFHTQYLILTSMYLPYYPPTQLTFNNILKSRHILEKSIEKKWKIDQIDWNQSDIQKILTNIQGNCQKNKFQQKKEREFDEKAQKSKIMINKNVKKELIEQEITNCNIQRENRMKKVISSNQNSLKKKINRLINFHKQIEQNTRKQTKISQKIDHTHKCQTMQQQQIKQFNNIKNEEQSSHQHNEQQQQQTNQSSPMNQFTFISPISLNKQLEQQEQFIRQNGINKFLYKQKQQQQSQELKDKIMSQSEIILLQWIIRQGQEGKTLKKSTIRNKMKSIISNNILYQMTNKQEEGICVGYKWFANFVKKHPQICHIVSAIKNSHKIKKEQVKQQQGNSISTQSEPNINDTLIEEEKQVYEWIEQEIKNRWIPDRISIEKMYRQKICDDGDKVNKFIQKYWHIWQMSSQLNAKIL